MEPAASVTMVTGVPVKAANSEGLTLEVQVWVPALKLVMSYQALMVAEAG